MAIVTITCDQAIFTSARGPTGEGYRIVAASKGLRAEEKQKIIRCSPSHESLCMPSETSAAPPVGVAFYALPGGRLCIALSRHAGAEHTGRGGQRVYTHNVIVNNHDFAQCGFNPFTLIRAISDATIDLQKLPHGGVIPPIELSIDVSTGRLDAECVSLLHAPVRLSALQLLMEEKPAVLDVPRDWLAWAEAMILAVPAPLRMKCSFAAGLKFATGRGHVLHLLRDEKQAVQCRAEAQGITFLGAKNARPPLPSQWCSFVDRHWASGDMNGLTRRTSQPFEDCSAPARERVGELYNSIDSIGQAETGPLLDLVFRSFNASHTGVEGDVRRDFRAAAQQQLRSRIAAAPWTQVKPFWGRLAEFWQNGGEAAAFAQPLLSAALNVALRTDPLIAGLFALNVAQPCSTADRTAHETMIQQLLSRLISMDLSISNDAPERLASIASRWRTIRPNCPLATQLCDRLATPHGVN